MPEYYSRSERQPRYRCDCCLADIGEEDPIIDADTGETLTPAPEGWDFRDLLSRDGERCVNGAPWMFSVAICPRCGPEGLDLEPYMTFEEIAQDGRWLKSREIAEVGA